MSNQYRKLTDEDLAAQIQACEQEPGSDPRRLTSLQLEQARRASAPMRSVRIRLTPKQSELLRAKAIEERTTISEIVRRLVERHFVRCEFESSFGRDMKNVQGRLANIELAINPSRRRPV